MGLSIDAISEFREIFEGEFSRPISKDEARDSAESFMRVVVLILRPLPSDRLAIKSIPPDVDGVSTFDTIGGNPPITPKRHQ